MDAGHAFLLFETAATLVMAGVLRIMQILNYPLLARVGREAFTSYETAHNRRFGLVVFPGVLAALAAAIGLLAIRPDHIPLWTPAANSPSSSLSSCPLPCCRVASTRPWRAGFDPRVLRRLVRTNWIRVAAWSAAGSVALWMCHEAFTP